MADLASLLIGGSFALGGAYLGPFMQSRQRKEERRREHRVMMRKHAEEIFELAAIMRASTIDLVLTLARGENVEQHSAFKSYHRLKALCATYFPALMSQFNTLGDKIDNLVASIELDDSIDSEAKALVQANAIRDVMIELIQKIEDNVTDEIRKYVTSE